VQICFSFPRKCLFLNIEIKILIMVDYWSMYIDCCLQKNGYIYCNCFPEYKLVSWNWILKTLEFCFHQNDLDIFITLTETLEIIFLLWLMNLYPVSEILYIILVPHIFVSPLKILRNSNFGIYSTVHLKLPESLERVRWPKVTCFRIMIGCHNSFIILIIP